MSELALEWNPTEERLESSRLLIVKLRREIDKLREENAQLRRQVCKFRCDADLWKSRHARAVEQNSKLTAELTRTQGEVRQLKDEG